MKPALALIRMNLKLAIREKSVLFFNYAFPLIFFFGFGQFMGGRSGGSAMTRVVSMVIVIGILGSGLFGAGMRAVMEREAGILRRYKVTPITPFPILIGSLVTGWLLYLPSVIIIFALGHYFYNMPWPADPFALFVLITLGSFAFRAIGLIIASVANSMAESNILIQVLYMPMLFLSGATIPVSVMPLGAQIVSQFLPASYLNSGVQHVMLRSEGLASNLEAVGALTLSTLLGLWISRKLFRWEKDEKLPNSSKALVVAVLAPFVLLGCYQAWSRGHIEQAKQLDRQIRRNNARLIRGATIFVGDGTVIRGGAILLRNGRIEAVYAKDIPDPDKIHADTIEAAGKTVLPGLVDVHVDSGESGGGIGRREVAAYLYCGVTAVRAMGDLTPNVVELKRALDSGIYLGAELFISGQAEVEPRSAHAPIPDVQLVEMKGKGIYYNPELSIADALVHVAEKNTDLLTRSLVQQVSKPEFLESSRRLVSSAKLSSDARLWLKSGMDNLLRAYKAGVPLVTGSGAGKLLIIHGPTVQHELELWVKAGIPPEAGLQAATLNAAKFLGAGDRIGLVRKGYEATFIIVDGNPLQDIASLEHVSTVFFKGERVERQDLFDQK